MTPDDFLRLQQNLNLPPHTPLKTQIDLLREDVLKLIAEIMRLKNALRDERQDRNAQINALQETAEKAHADGANALREAALEVCCPACTIALKQLTAERTFQ